MVNFILFVLNVIIKIYNAFAIHKAIGKQASLTKKIIWNLRNILTYINPITAEAQEIDNTSDHSDNNSHPSNNNYTIKREKKNSKTQYRPQEQLQINITQSPFLIDHDDDDIYVDTNYKHYNATVRRSNKGIQLINIGYKKEKDTYT